MIRQLARCLLVAGTILCVSAPGEARADGLLVPWFGGVFSQDPVDSARASVGLSYGAVSSGDLFGFELDFGYTPSFFGNKSAVGKNSMVTLMADLIVGPSFETRAGKGVRPYGVFGIGLVHPEVGGNADNNFGWNAAGGVMGYFTSNVGVRFDLRYFHTVDNTSAANTIQLEPGAIHFWRASVGVVIR
jgi:opacity protein-like surface antigen